MNSKMPIIFVWHGSPMNAIENNEYTDTWKKIGKSMVKKPQAIIVFSAHWITYGETRIANSKKPGMIYDMYGFPEVLYHVWYDAPGHPDLAREIMDLLKLSKVNAILDDKRWYDHGVWSTLIHLFPSADIPVVMISLDYEKDPVWHFEIGKKLSFLREKGVLLIWSGNIVHNLSLLDWSDWWAYSWAREFDARFASWIQNSCYKELCYLQNWWDISRYAHPSHDHLLPIFPLFGATWETDSVEFFSPEVTLSSIAMRSVYWHEYNE